MPPGASGFLSVKWGQQCPRQRGRGGLNEQAGVYKALATIITTSFLALSEKLGEGAPCGVGSDSGGAEQPDGREKPPSLISPVGSIRLERFISQMPRLVALFPSAKCSFFFFSFKNFSLGSVCLENKWLANDKEDLYSYDNFRAISLTCPGCGEPPFPD